MSYNLFVAGQLTRLRRLISALGVAMLEDSTADPGPTTPVLVFGSGVPATAHPNGSVALRLDGATPAEVVYFRQGGAWVAAELDSGSGAIADAGGYYTTDTIDAAFDALALQIGGDDDATFAFTEDNVVADDDGVYAALDKLDVAFAESVGDMGSVASAAINMATNPTATDTLTVGADVYEFQAAAADLASDTNIAVEIKGSAALTLAELINAINAIDGDNQHPTIFQTDSVTPALANGTENLLADIVGTTGRIRSATVPGGTVVGADPSIVLAEALTDVSDIWNVGDVNMNTLSGKAKATRDHAVTKVAVTAAMIANGYSFEFPFTPIDFKVQVLSAAGVPAIGSNVVPADTFVITADAVVVSFNGGAGDIQATDVVTIEAWS